MYRISFLSRLNSIYHFLRPYFVHVSVNSWYVFSFWLSWIWLLWILVHKYLFTPLAFNSFEYIPRSRITGWYSNSMFNFLKIGQTVFHSSCFFFYSRQQCTRFPMSSHPLQLSRTGFVVDLSLPAVLIDVNWYLVVV